MKDVKPFFVPSENAVIAGRWQRWVEDAWEDVDDYIEDWDQTTNLLVRCLLTADMPAIRQTTGLIDSSPLAWSAGWRALDTGLVETPLTVKADGNAEFPLQFEIPAARAGATIALTRRLVLMRDRIMARPGQPRWAGSILWSDDFTVRLTGKGSAFPSEVANFDDLYPGREASWYLELPASVDAPALGSMVLMLNEKDKDLVQAVAARKPNDYQRLLVETMEEGVVEELVRWALSRWGELENPEEETVGAVGRRLATRTLPDPEAWIGDEVDSMALKAAIVYGARSIGRGRKLE